MTRSRSWMLRLAALMGIGTYALHQLRYLLGYHAEPEHGHAYLSTLGPVLAGVVALAIAELVAGVAGGRAREGAPRLRRLWPCTSLGLIGVYCGQELTEGSPLGAHGGWVALPLAVGVGLLVALLMRGAGTAESVAASIHRRPWSAPPPVAPRVVAIVARPRTHALGARLPVSARAPPALPA